MTISTLTYPLAFIAGIAVMSDNDVRNIYGPYPIIGGGLFGLFSGALTSIAYENEDRIEKIKTPGIRSKLSREGLLGFVLKYVKIYTSSLFVHWLLPRVLPVHQHYVGVLSWLMIIVGMRLTE